MKYCGWRHWCCWWYCPPFSWIDGQFFGELETFWRGLGGCRRTQWKVLDLAVLMRYSDQSYALCWMWRKCRPCVLDIAACILIPLTAGIKAGFGGCECGECIVWYRSCWFRGGLISSSSNSTWLLVGWPTSVWCWESIHRHQMRLSMLLVCSSPMQVSPTYVAG